ncbi:MAG: DUF1330 domain-containing protein [Rhodospirillaceae bacterium]|nr:DUF1330 domain-containing protein [Rhodospirillaceae bacterium]
MLKHLIVATLVLTTGPALAASSTCDAPAHMLIMGGTPDSLTLTDEMKAGLRTYAAEVPGIVANFGGVFKARGRANAVIEGDWPAWKNIVVSEWPCLDAGHKFWTSDAYAKIHGLRTQATDYRIALYPPLKQDPRATGVWTAAGGPQGQCDAPIYLLVTVDVTNPEKIAAYRKALTDSGLQYAYGAVDVLQGAPAEILEGDWPKNFNAKVTRWPCREAFEAFFASADYNTKYKPLRQDAGVFTAIIAAEYKQK